MTSNITGVVLAGGRGRRMNGQDKGLLPLRGRPLAAQVLEILRLQVTRLLISANRNLELYSALGAPVITDTFPGFQGPLAGMLAGLRSAETDWVLFVPCDAASLPADLALRLRRALCADTKAAYATTQGNHFYTCCLLHRSLADEIEAALRAGRRAVHDFLAAHAAVAVDFPGWPAELRNLNTPEDWRKVAAPDYSVRGQA